MRKKKLAALALAALMGMSTLAGCGVTTTSKEGKSQDSTSKTEMTGKGKDTINILIYAQEHEKAAYEEQIRKFTEAHKDAIKKVNFEVTTHVEHGM